MALIENDVLPVQYLFTGKDTIVRVVGQNLGHVLSLANINGCLELGLVNSKPQDEVIRYTEFDIGLVKFEFAMMDMELMVDMINIEKYAEIPKKFPKKYVGVVAIGDQLWVWYATNELNALDTMYTKMVKRLGEGESVSINDLLNTQKPISISLNGINYE